MHDEIFVANVGSPGDSVQVFHRTDDGNVAPLRTISGTNTGLGSPSDVFVDTLANELFVLNQNASILVFARDANGNTPPLRTIAGSATELTKYYSGFAVDITHAEIIVAETESFNLGGKVLFFDSHANGNVAPKREIVGEASHLVSPMGVVLDSQFDEIFVSDWGPAVGAVNPWRIFRVYDRSASGNALPLREFAPGIRSVSSAVMTLK